MHGRSRKRAVPTSPPTQEEQPSLELIAGKLERLTWRHRLFGVDERQAWHVIQRLDEMYRQLYREQEIKYQALLDQAYGQSQSSQTQAMQQRQSQRPGRFEVIHRP